MNVTLRPEDQELVDQKVSSGQYPNADAVVADALQALRDREKLDKHERQRIRESLDERWAEANDASTKWVDGKEVFERLRKRIGEHKRARGDEAV